MNKEDLMGKDWYQQQEVVVANLRDAIAWYTFVVMGIKEPLLEKINEAVDKIFEVFMEEN